MFWFAPLPIAVTVAIIGAILLYYAVKCFPIIAGIILGLGIAFLPEVLQPIGLLVFLSILLMAGVAHSTGLNNLSMNPCAGIVLYFTVFGLISIVVALFLHQFIYDAPSTASVEAIVKSVDAQEILTKAIDYEWFAYKVTCVAMLVLAYLKSKIEDYKFNHSQGN